MKALRWHAARDLRLDDVPEPDEPGPGEAIVSVSYCGICGTDLHEYTDGPVMIRPGAHPLTGASPPLTLGHEFSGTLVALNQNVTGFELGQRVAVDPCWRCDDCYWCARGDYHICKRGGSIGLASDGALAPLVRVQAQGIVPLTEEIDDRTAALIEPLAVGLHAVRRGRVEPGDRVLVFGCGPIGAAVILAARAAGALVYVTEPTAKRRELALELGATEAFDPETSDPRREVYIRTARVGPDVVFECTGVASLVPHAIDSARRGGRIVLVGVGHGTAAVAPQSIVPYEREVLGSLGYRHDLPRVVELIRSGAMDPAPMITGVVELEDAVRGAFDVLLADRGHQMKLLIAVDP